MKRLIVESYLLILCIEFLMFFRSFNELHKLVERGKVGKSCPDRSDPPAQLCRAIDLACVFYPKQVLCLQRSSATTLLLRRHGIRAEMVIGTQMLPFKSHAWVEVGSAVVNDKPYMRELYHVIERC
jgi:Transglutaminase-like superfamily